MDLTNPDQLWAVLAAISIISYLLGRASAGRGSSTERGARRLRDQEAAISTFSSLDTSKQIEIDRLLEESKVIEAIKHLREATGMSLYESKLAIDERRKIVKGA